MSVNLDEDNLKDGLLGVVVALVEIIKDALELQVEKRIENNSLTEEEIERAGQALLELEETISDVKEREDIQEATDNFRDQLDEVVDDAVNEIANPKKWADEIEEV